LSTKDFERWLKGALEVGRRSLWELCEGNLEGGLPCRDPWRIGIKGSEKVIYCHRGPVGDPGRVLVYQGI
jgi:hypothetical protein